MIRKPGYDEFVGDGQADFSFRIDADAFDRFVAAAMSGHDMLYKLARERMANEPRQPDS